MAERININDIYNAITSLNRALIILGVIEEGSTVMVQEGNASQGHSWELRTRTQDGRVKLMPGIDLHGRQTKREAYDRITAASYMAWEIINAPIWDKK